jgi:signal transduction histidine kinase
MLMPDTSSSYEQVGHPSTPSASASASGEDSLPGRLTWLITLPAVIAAALFAVTAGYLGADDEHPVLIVVYVVAVVAVLIAAVYAVRSIRRAGDRSSGLRAEAAEARSALSGTRAELAEARSDVNRLTERLREAEARPAPVAAPAGHTGGRQVEVFVNLSRRLQSLVHREIKLLDALENEVEDPDLLKGLFQVDHLATRIRRHAENLAVLGGSVSRRQWSRPVALTEVLRSAIAEVEHYSRVKLVPPIEGTVPGHAVASVIHLVAELIENATMFAPPHTQVLLRAQQVVAGVAVEVEDRGLGMQRADQERINLLLANPEDINLDDLLRDGRIGLFVVSMIARQHGIVVRLQTNIYGGTQAVVILPQLLLGAGAPEDERAARPPSLIQHTVEMAQQQPSWSAFTPSSASSRPGTANGGRNDRPARQVASASAAVPEHQQQRPAVEPTPARPPLPRRHSQTHLAPQLQLGPPRPAAEPAGEHTHGLMASFMNGVSQGEADQPNPDRHG